MCEFVRTHFEDLSPESVDFWLDEFPVNERRELYTSMNCSIHKQYMTTKLLAYLLEDFVEPEAIGLMCEFVDEGVQVDRLVSVKLVEKLLNMLQQPTVVFSFTHLGVGIYMHF